MIKKLILAGLGILFAGGLAFGTTRVLAESNNGQFSPLIQALVDKFNLDKTQVQGVVDQFRQDRQKDMQTKFTAKLDQLVQSGKITADQKTLILNKFQVLENSRQTNMENWKNLTLEERKAKMEAERTDLENWAKQYNIDLSLFGGKFGFGWMGMMGKGFGFGRGMHGRFGDSDDNKSFVSPSPSPSS